MATRQALLVTGLALLLSACSHPGGTGWGNGPGMVGRGYGMGMMGGGHGMGMMGAPGALVWGLERLDLSADQRSRIAAIQDELHKRHWASMQAMHAESSPMGAWVGEGVQRQRFEQMNALHKQMFDAHLDARRHILEVLTPAQRQQLTAGNKPEG